MANLDAQIVEAERMAAVRPSSELRRLLILYSTRAELFGRVRDMEAMLTVGERAVATFPDDPTAYVTRAHARTFAHLFKDAEADLEKAVALGGQKTTIADYRSTLYAATGRLELALAAAEQAAGRDALHLARQAAILAELGQLLRAEELFIRAAAGYQETSPFPIAWVYLLHARMWERAGNDQRARSLYASALAKVPQLLPGAIGLARVLMRANATSEAVTLLRPFRTSEDPEAVALLAELSTGEEAAALLAEADARYHEIFKKHPAAYADHAAHFWLRNKDQPALALIAAKKNLENRETREAFELALLSALAARDHAEACALVARIKSRAELAQTLAPLAAAAACE